MSDHSKILRFLHLVFVEIRGTENIKKARILADVVHNVPMMIKNDRSHEAIIDEIARKAKRQGAEEYFSNLLKHMNNVE